MYGSDDVSKSDTKTPILIRIDNKLYRIIEMMHAKDGSIYFYMPRKKGYILDSSNIRKHYKKNIFHILTRLSKAHSPLGILETFVYFFIAEIKTVGSEKYRSTNS